MTTMEAARSTMRLIDKSAQQSPPTLEAHHRRHGLLPILTTNAPDWGDRLLVEIERAGLTGRGGAGFPAFKKLRLAQSGRRPTIVVNAMEGEPASRKDRFLISSSPHLVLDGAELLARALDAKKIVICVPGEQGNPGLPFARALDERAAHWESLVSIEIRELAERYIAGEESALVSGVAGEFGLPKFRPDKSVPLSIGRDTAIVHNVETLANVALIARYGATWFKEIGPAEAPGTCLVTISGGVEHPGVVEVAIGTPIKEILRMASPKTTVQAVLVGGYGGTWLSGEDSDVPYAPNALRELGASMGAGILIALPADSCGIRETERIARFMASESAGQCGPCLFGLPAIADDLKAIANAKTNRKTLDRLVGRCGAVDGRGACRHPDGVVRLVRSALAVFSSDVESHLRGRACSGSTRSSILAGRLSISERRVI